MEKFSALLALCEGNHWSTVEPPHKDRQRGALYFVWSAPDQTVEQTIETPIIWDAIELIMTCL